MRELGGLGVMVHKENTAVRSADGVAGASVEGGITGDQVAGYWRCGTVGMELLLAGRFQVAVGLSLGREDSTAVLVVHCDTVRLLMQHKSSKFPDKLT
jgi:hypothetical protein